ncbi:MAG TPA: cyclase family protein [Steroidobacteraceae bacterium]|nr:cyclase family protein [Steroidobacteraceae bacterium]
MSDTTNVMRFEAHGRRYKADVGKPLSLAIPLDFAGPQPSCFDAPRAEARPLRAGGFVGDTRAGGSCNCEVVTLAPHCNGTHTECIGHVTDDRVAVSERVPGGLVLARLVTIAPAAASASGESSDPRPAPEDRLITAAALAAACAGVEEPLPSALVVRTTDAEANRAYRGPAPAPFLTREAAAWLVSRGIDTLVLDVPSADRADDGGKLTAHRVFFGLPPGSRRAADSTRPRASLTELAWIPGDISDGLYLLDLQLPAFVSDAAPSRPLLFAVRPA